MRRVYLICTGRDWAGFDSPVPVVEAPALDTGGPGLRGRRGAAQRLGVVPEKCYDSDMTYATQKLYEDALDLSTEDRSKLAGLLLESLEDLEDQGVEAAWRTEVARRMAELEAGTVRPVPWEEAEAMIFGDEDGRGSIAAMLGP